MKLLSAVVLSLASLSLASDLIARQGPRPKKEAARPQRFTSGNPGGAQAARRPPGAPADYKTGTGSATASMSRANLIKLPPELIGRRDAWMAMAKIRGVLTRQSTANDFYECKRMTPAPSSADCNVIIDNVYNTGQNVVLAAGSCVTFAYRTCQGFFCALCGPVSTSTDFIGNQLVNADWLCVSKGGQGGTIVGTDPPQWDAGFTTPNAALPNYNVC